MATVAWAMPRRGLPLCHNALLTKAHIGSSATSRLKRDAERDRPSPSPGRVGHAGRCVRAGPCEMPGQAAPWPAGAGQHRTAFSDRQLYFNFIPPTADGRVRLLLNGTEQGLHLVRLAVACHVRAG